MVVNSTTHISKNTEDITERYTNMDISGWVDYNVKENESLDVDILESFDAYMEDINDRLTISRMVSDSVIKGMVNAIEQETLERIAQKEWELAGLKKMLHVYQVGSEQNESLDLSIVANGTIGTCSFSDTAKEHDRLAESLDSLRSAVKQQFKKLMKELGKTRGSSYIRRINSGFESVGVGGILQEKKPERGIYVDETLDCLWDTLESFFREVDILAKLLKASISQQQEEDELRSEIESMVTRHCIRSLQQEFEQKLWDQNDQINGTENVNWLDKFKEISSLRQELDSISRALFISETGQLTSHGSMDNDEDGSDNKRTDHFPWKHSANNFSNSTLHWEGNGKIEDSKVSVTENLDSEPLKHMSRDELIIYHKSEMNKLKRSHESQVQVMTEEYFKLKRELLRERSSSLPLKKDKEFDSLRKKIPDVITKLNDILSGHEALYQFSANANSLSNLKDRLELLRSENNQLTDVLIDKKKEIKSLSSQISDAADKLSYKHQSEKCLKQMVQNLECNVEDAHLENSFVQDVYECLLRGMIGEFRCTAEETDMKFAMMQEIYEVIYNDAVCSAQPASMSEIEDAEMESIVMQRLLGVMYSEALVDAEGKLRSLNQIYIDENHTRLNLEREAFEKQEALKLEKEELKQEILSLKSVINQKEKEVEDVLFKANRKMESVFEEMNKLRQDKCQLQNSISEISKESNVLKDKLSEALEKIELNKKEMFDLHQKLESTRKELDEERNMLGVVTQEKLKALRLVETKEREHRTQMELTGVFVQGLLKSFADFECRVKEETLKNGSRLEKMCSQFSILNKKASMLRNEGLTYKRKLERKRSNLERAEAEVDLLGDEVDYLLSLLEKIYIALDHYSPILRHYSGITEILELVRRELSGNSIKAE